MKTVPSIEALNTAILYGLYELLVFDSESESNVEEITSKIPSEASPAYIGKILMALRNDGVIEATEYAQDDDYYSISLEMVERIQAALTTDGSTYADYAQNKEEWLGKSILKQNQIPAADRRVTLDHNSKELQDLEISIDDLIESIRQNRVNDVSDETQVAILKIKAGREMLSGPEIDVQLVADTLISGLRWVAEKTNDLVLEVAQEIVKDKVKLVLALALAYFGIS